MGFYFARELKQLRIFVNEMRKLGVGIGIFPFQYNGIFSNVIIDMFVAEFNYTLMQPKVHNYAAV